MRISDWSSDVCSSDLHVGHLADRPDALPHPVPQGQLRRLLHAADGGPAFDRVSRLQRRLGLGRHRGGPGARHHRRQLQQHSQLQHPGSALHGRQAGLLSAPLCSLRPISSDPTSSLLSLFLFSFSFFSFFISSFFLFFFFFFFFF